MLLYFIEPLLQLVPEFAFHVLCELLCVRFAIVQQILCVYLARVGVLDRAASRASGRAGAGSASSSGAGGEALPAGTLFCVTLR